MTTANTRPNVLFWLLGGAALLGTHCGGDDTTATPSTGAGGAGGSGGSAGTDASSPDGLAPEGGEAQAPEGAASEAGGMTATNVLYVESNDPRDGMNSIIAFSRAADGSLTTLAGSPFSTGGTGLGNPLQVPGPNDSDQEIIASPDRRFLFAVNGGSASVAVLDVHANGSLTPVTSSPFTSGGTSPVSLGLANQTLYVVNQGQEPGQSTGGTPNYTAMSVAANGTLSPIAGSTIEAGASPSQALVSTDKKLLFGADFLAPAASPPQGSLRSFTIGANQVLTNAPGMPMALPVASNGMPDTSGALGLATHPAQKILYAGFPQRNQLGVYTYDATTGALTFIVAAPVSGLAPCWTRTSANGTRVYVVTSANNSVSVLDATNPLAPAEMQNFHLKDPGPLYQNAAGVTVPTSQAFQEELSPDGRFLYVVSERTTTNPTVTEGNVLHTLTIGTDGTLSEPLADIKLAVPTEARPQGLVVF